MMTDYAIESLGLEKVYYARFSGREIKAVSNLNLRVPAGTKFGLLGPNGAGKTTFVKMLLSAVHPTSGAAKIFGQDARDEKARQPVGYLPENHRFPVYLTGAGMLHFYGALSGLDSRQLKILVPQYLDMVGLNGWGETRIKKYSKGMLQRLGLAQALIHEPRLLVLDEPTDGVDPVGRREIRDILNKLTGDGVTVFLNSHLLSEVESFCEYVAILRKGELAIEGKISNLISGAGYRVVATSVTEKILDDIRHSGAAIATLPDGVAIEAPTRQASNTVIDILRAGGALIETVSASTSTLEDVFIRATRQEKAP